MTLIDSTHQLTPGQRIRFAEGDEDHYPIGGFNAGDIVTVLGTVGDVNVSIDEDPTTPWHITWFETIEDEPTDADRVAELEERIEALEADRAVLSRRVSEIAAERAETHDKNRRLANRNNAQADTIAELGTKLARLEALRIFTTGLLTEDQAAMVIGFTHGYVAGEEA